MNKWLPNKNTFNFQSVHIIGNWQRGPALYYVAVPSTALLIDETVHTPSSIQMQLLPPSVGRVAENAYQLLPKAVILICGLTNPSQKLMFRTQDLI
jgi:hypothetical protein